MIKCACGDPKCLTHITFDKASKIMFFHDKNGEETAMYLDANTAVNLITELRNFIKYLTTEGEI